MCVCVCVRVGIYAEGHNEAIEKKSERASGDAVWPRKWKNAGCAE